MTCTIVNVDQRSAEWYAARCGRLTSSVVATIFMKGKTKDTESVTKRDLRIRLALEQMTGKAQDDGNGYRSREMEYGVEREPDARLAYEAHTGQLLRDAGFVSRADLLIGCSPDGYVGDFDGGVELKCPKTATHLEYLKAKAIPDDYLPQMRHHLFVTGAKWWDFVSFDDRLPEPLQLVVRRLWAVEAELPAHELAVRAFLGEVEKQKAEIEALAGAAA